MLLMTDVKMAQNLERLTAYEILSPMEKKFIMDSLGIDSKNKDVPKKNSSFMQSLDLSDSNDEAIRASVPWGESRQTPEEISLFSNSSILECYTSYVLEEIQRKRSVCVLSKFFKVYRKLQIFSDSVETNRIYEKFIHYFAEYNSQKPSLLIEFFDEICVSNETKQFVFMPLLRGWRCEDIETLGYILRMANKAKFDFWGIWSDNIYENYDLFCPVTSAIMYGNLAQLTQLLQYGFRINVHRMQLSIKISQSTRCKPFTFDKSLDTRCIAVIELFLLLRSKHMVRTKVFQQCLKLLWRSTPYPYIKSFELRNFVAQMTEQESIIPDMALALSELCNTYAFLFPEESKGLLEPRTLQHMCLCSVRQALRKSRCLPDGIEKLRLPTIIKGYLMLK